MKKKKRGSIKSGGKKSLLKEAIIDIDAELKRLNSEKTSLKTQISKLDKNVESAQVSEKELQGKIARLLEKEASLRLIEIWSF